MKQFSAVGFVQILLAMTTEAEPVPEPEPEVEPPQPPLDQKKTVFCSGICTNIARNAHRSRSRS